MSAQDRPHGRTLRGDRRREVEHECTTEVDIWRWEVLFDEVIAEAQTLRA